MASVLIGRARLPQIPHHYRAIDDVLKRRTRAQQFGYAPRPNIETLVALPRATASTRPPRDRRDGRHCPCPSPKRSGPEQAADLLALHNRLRLPEHRSRTRTTAGGQVFSYNRGLSRHRGK